MKKTTPLILFIIVALLAFKCDDEDNSKPDRNEAPKGSWLLYETGHSPGSGYITEPVPANPPQYIRFDFANRMFTTIKGWEKYNYYRIVVVDATNTTVLAIYEDDPGNGKIDVRKLDKDSYSMNVIDGELKLSYRYCIEGCHMAFKKVSSK